MSMSTLCCKELNPVFDRITEETEKQKGCIYESAEWDKAENQLVQLFKQAESIFLRYNPEYRNGKPKDWEARK